MYESKEGSLTYRIQSLLKKRGYTVPELVAALGLEVSLRTQGTVYQALRRMGARKSAALPNEGRRGPQTHKFTLRGV